MAVETSRAQELLQPFREAERRADAFAVLGDPETCRVLLAWTRTAPAWSPPSGAPPDDLPSRWRWLWFEQDVCPSLLASSARVSPIVARKAFESLRDMWAIYPDGTANQHALDFMNDQIASHLRGNHTRPR